MHAPPLHGAQPCGCLLCMRCVHTLPPDPRPPACGDHGARTLSPPPCTRAVQMGLGKTLEMLLLVLANPAPQGWAITGHSHKAFSGWVGRKGGREGGSVGGRGKGGLGCRRCSRMGGRGALMGGWVDGWLEAVCGATPLCKSLPCRDGGQRWEWVHAYVWANPANNAVSRTHAYCRAASEEDKVPIKATLIVAPSNLIGQWADELGKHVVPGALTWCDLARPACVSACMHACMHCTTPSIAHV